MASEVDRHSVDPEVARALAALRSLPGASVAVFDAHLRYLLVSGSAAGVAGVDDAELEGRLITDVQPREWWTGWEPLARAALRGEANSVDLLAADGRSYRVSVGPWRSAEGDVAGGVAVFSDVTDRTRALTLAEGLLESAPDATVVVDPNGFIVRVNGHAEKLFGYDRSELLAQRIEMLIPEKARRGHVAKRSRYSQDPHPREIGAARGLLARRRDGTEFPVDVSLSPLETEDGRVISSAIRDITERKRLEQDLHDARERELADSNARYRQIVETTPDGIWRLDSEGRADYINPRMAEMLGYAPEEMIGRSYADFVAPEWSKFAADRMTRVRENSRPDVTEICLTRKDGQPCWARASHITLRDAGGAAVGVLGIMSDITDAKSQQRELRSTECFLAGLIESIGDGILAFDREGEFKFANHAAEQLLGGTADELAARFAHAKAGTVESGAPRQELYGRMLSPLTTGTPLRAKEDSFVLTDGRELPVSYSAAPIVIDGQIDGLVVTFSDITARKAQEERRRQELEAAAWVGRILDALDEDRFVLYQQPIIDVVSREIIRYELLIRMVSRDGEIIAPGRFLPTAEQYGLITDIDLWVTQQACRIAATGRKVNFNISGKSLGSRVLIAALTDELNETGADPALLVCEITETAIAVDEALAEAFVTELIGLGCEVGLDDFGMGYGGLSYLKHFAFTELKIDMEFGRDLVRNQQNQHVVKAIASLAQGFGRKTVAEGIEDVAALDLLQEYGVDYAQGYAIGQPAPIDTPPPRADPPSR
jgi:PAS domain S-box-containing protein